MKERKNLFDKALSRVTPESRAHAAFSILAAKRAREIMHDKGITMTDLAGRMKKNISEVSRMLSGMQNLTMKNFVLLNQALGEDVITVTTSAKAKIEVPTPAFSELQWPPVHRWVGTTSLLSRPAPHCNQDFFVVGHTISVKGYSTIKGVAPVMSRFYKSSAKAKASNAYRQTDLTS
jgi:transcriptional regulator with XRE-family HTH domain